MGATNRNLSRSRINMKKIVLGSIMFLSGILSVAIILAGSMSNEWNVNGQFSSFWNISQYGLMPIMYIFITVAVIGLAIAVWGLFDKKDK